MTSSVQGQVLSNDDITALLSNTRSRGEYAQVLSDFLDSGEPGIKVDLETGILAGKTVNKAFAGFNNARTAINKETGAPKIPGALSIKVIKSKDGEQLYLVNQTKVNQ